MKQLLKDYIGIPENAACTSPLKKAQSLKVVLSEHTVWVRTCQLCFWGWHLKRLTVCITQWLTVTFRVLGFHKSTLVFSWKEQLHGLRRRKLGLVALHWYSKQLHATTWTNIARGAPQKSILPPLQINGLLCNLHRESMILATFSTCGTSISELRQSF